MPVYEFRCQDCGNKFTVLCGISEKDKLTCPECNSSNIRQVISACGFQIKGGSCGTGNTAGG